MEPRHKKLIFALGVMPFLLVYCGLVLWIWDSLPDNRVLELIFFILAGTVWAFPLKPLMQWMTRPKDE